MGMEQRLLALFALPTPRIHVIPGQEEGHVYDAAVVITSNCLPSHSFRLRVRVSVKS